MPINEMLQQNQGKLNSFELEEIYVGSIISGMVEVEWFQKLNKNWIISNNVKTLWSICANIIANDEILDYVSVNSRYSKLVGAQASQDYLNRIISQIPNNFSPTNTLAELESNYIVGVSLREIEIAKSAISKNPFHSTEIFAAASEKISRISSGESSFDLENEFNDIIDKIVSGELTKMVIKTGIEGIDKFLGGIARQEITIGAGRPGHGKTTFASELVLSCIDKNDKLGTPIRVALFELEMSKLWIKTKMVSSESKVSFTAMRNAMLTADERGRVLAAKEGLKRFNGKLFLYDNVYDAPTMNRICRSNKIDLAVVDFITLMDGVGEDKRNELGNIAKMFKRFAKHHNMAYVVLSQLNRGPETREGNRPISADLAESDQLSQLASEILLLFYQYKYSFDPAHINKLRIIFDKARYSGVNETLLFFNPDVITLRDPRPGDFPAK